MLRNQLSAAVKNAAENLGYAFYKGFGYRMNEKSINFPAAWWAPPKIRSVHGRNEGFVIYRVELVLMAANRKYDEAAKNHFADSLSALGFIPCNAKVIDVGMGGGFPSVPLSKPKAVP